MSGPTLPRPGVPGASAPPVLPSGRGVRVAVIDSGVDATHPFFARAEVASFEVVARGEAHEVVEGPAVDLSGHGTACAGIVHRLAPEAKLVSVRAIGREGRGSREALLAALRFTVRERFEVVSCSLGIDLPRGGGLRPVDQRGLVDLYEIADAAYVAGVVIVASGPNVTSFKTYPGRFKSLVGVGRGAFADPEMLESAVTADYEILAPGTDVPAPALGGGERRWTGTSFACPHVAAHVARLRAARPGLPLDLVRAGLHDLARARAGGEATGVSRGGADATA